MKWGSCLYQPKPVCCVCLKTGEFIKVGSSKVLKTNVRIVAATNVNLIQAVADGKFREDLYYRLNTVPIQIPPLRERPDDIILLFRKFAGDCAEKYRMPSIRLDEEPASCSLHTAGRVTSVN